MALIGSFINEFNTLLDDAAQTAFGSVLSYINPIAATAATLLIILLVINSLIQFRYIDMGTLISTIIRCLIVISIGLVWGNFQTIYAAISDTMDLIAGALLSDFKTGIDASDSSVGMARGIDDFLSQFFEKSTSGLENLSWMGNIMMSGIILVLSAIIGASAVVIIILSKIVTTVYVGLAPIFIGFSIFPVTRDYFNKWVSGLFTYLLYPVVIAGVIGLTMRLVLNFVGTIGTESTSISDFLPFVAALILTVIMIFLIPSIVTALSGTIAVITPKDFLGKGAPAARSGMSVAQRSVAPTQALAGAAPSSVKNVKEAGYQASGMSLAAKQAARSERLRR